jgi:hypothetical protein
MTGNTGRAPLRWIFPRLTKQNTDSEMELCPSLRHAFEDKTSSTLGMVVELQSRNSITA